MKYFIGKRKKKARKYTAQLAPFQLCSTDLLLFTVTLLPATPQLSLCIAAILQVTALPVLQLLPALLRAALLQTTAQAPLPPLSTAREAALLQAAVKALLQLQQTGLLQAADATAQQPPQVLKRRTAFPPLLRSGQASSLQGSFSMSSLFVPLSLFSILSPTIPLLPCRRSFPCDFRLPTKGRVWVNNVLAVSCSGSQIGSFRGRTAPPWLLM